MNGFGLFSNLVERVQSTIDANLGIDSEQAKEAMGESSGQDKVFDMIPLHCVR